MRMSSLAMSLAVDNFSAMSADLSTSSTKSLGGAITSVYQRLGRCTPSLTITHCKMKIKINKIHM